MARLRARESELSEAVEGRVRAKKRLEEIGEEEKALTEKLEALQNLARDTQERADIEEDIEDFHRRYRSLESAANLMEEDQRLQAEERESYGSLRRVLEGKREELGELELRRAGVSEGLAILRRKMEVEAGPGHSPWAPYVVVSGLTLVLVGLAGIALSPYMLFISLFGALMVLAALFPGGYIGFLKKGRDCNALQSQIDELEDMEKKLTQRMEGIIAEAGCDSVDRFTELKLGYLELLARRKEIADKLEVLMPEKGMADVEEEARKLATEVSLRERRLKELRGRTVDAGKLQEILNEMDKLRARLDNLREETIRLEVGLNEEGVEEDLLQVREELEFLSEKRERLLRKAKALQLASRWMEEATSATLSTAARRLENRIGEFMGKITEGRYTKIQVDEGTFGIRVWSPEKEGEVEAEVLSRGTVDQLYLAARLSLVEIICDDCRPPLLLDDPFVTFDSRRLEKAMEVIKDFSRGKQIIIFTCGDQYDPYADHLVELRPVTA
jgi:DNA repair exonuclease SbcCD ATPase subunit